MDRFQNTGQPDWDWWGRLWPTPGATLRTLGLERGDTVAEVGCGNGYFALPAAAVVAPASVYAVDLEADHLAQVEHLADQQHLGNVETVDGDARELAALLPEPVDVALVANTLHGAEDVEGFLAQVVAALESDGRMVVVNWRDQPRAETTVAGEPRGPPTELRMTPGETAAAVRADESPVTIDREELPPYHYGLVVQR
jgi:SAM-dependent methyltransferase